MDKSLSSYLHFSHDNGYPISGFFKNPQDKIQAWTFDDVKNLIPYVEKKTKEGYWAIGFLSYESAGAFDNHLITLPPLSYLPLAYFAFYHPKEKLPIESLDLSHLSDSHDFHCEPWQFECDYDAYVTKLNKVKESIAKGDYYQTNVTHRLMTKFSGSSIGFFQSLMKAQPDCYSFYLEGGDWQIASVSPELFFHYDPISRLITTQPMKGTSPLSQSPLDLIKSEKDRAENLMIVDLLRNDLSQISEVGSVNTPSLFTVQTLSTLHQMTSTIQGKLKKNKSLIDIISALFPCGSITGAPKIAAMKALTELEISPRGPYCGALGVVSPSGEALFTVGIRTVTLHNSQAICGLGSGVTWDSEPQKEWEECKIKSRFLNRASGSFDILETMLYEEEGYFLLDRHCHRLHQSATFFGYPSHLEKIKAFIANIPLTITSPARVRVCLDRHGTLSFEASPLPLTPPSPVVELATMPIDSESDFVKHKTTNRKIYESFSPSQPEIFDCLLFNKKGELTEFTRGNLCLEIEGHFYTPPLSSGLLPGVFRDHLLKEKKMTEKILTRDTLASASKIYFLNSLRKLFPVSLSQESLLRLSHFRDFRP
jgi:para-aminobenzoate synthetase/4-amino-4-deoxychorismate lyase